MRVALERAVVIDQRRKFNLTAGSSDSIRRRTEGAGNGGRQEVLDAADHQRLEFRGALQGRDLRVEHRQAKRDHDLGLGVCELIFELPRCRQWTEIDDPPARHEHCKKADHEVRCVGQVQSDVHAGRHPERLQALCGSCREVV